MAKDGQTPVLRATANGSGSPTAAGIGFPFYFNQTLRANLSLWIGRWEVVDGAQYSEDDLMPAVDAGAEDIVLDEDVFEVITEPSDLTAVRGALVESGIEVQEASVMQRPKTLVPLDEDGAVKVMKLIDALEDLDDTDTVHANFDVDAEILERVAG